MPYATEISLTENNDFPYLVTIRDELGKLIGTFPASNQAEAEANLVTVLKVLAEEANKKL